MKNHVEFTKELFPAHRFLFQTLSQWESYLGTLTPPCPLCKWRRSRLCLPERLNNIGSVYNVIPPDVLEVGTIQGLTPAGVKMCHSAKVSHFLSYWIKKSNKKTKIGPKIEFSIVVGHPTDSTKSDKIFIF